MISSLGAGRWSGSWLLGLALCGQGKSSSFCAWNWRRALCNRVATTADGGDSAGDEVKAQEARGEGPN